MASNVPQVEEKLSVSVVVLEVKKIVIVVGTTGSGKSTIINMLFNNDYHKETCEEPCPVGATASSVTKEPEWHFNSSDGKVYGDTIGLGDTSRSDLEIAKGIKNFIKMFSHGVHCIIIVAKFGRFTKQEHCTLKIISQMFDSRWVNSCIMVLTHYDLDIGQESEQREIDKWLGEDQVIKEFVSKIGKQNIILTDNSLGRYEVANQPLRKLCLAKLNEFINSCNTVVSFPRDILEILKMIVEILFTFTGAGVTGLVGAATSIAVSSAASAVGTVGDRIGLTRANTVFKYLKSNNVKTGMCPICFEVMELNNMAQTECHHIFHLDCVTAVVKKRGDPCPYCRQSVHKVCVVALNLLKPYCPPRSINID